MNPIIEDIRISAVSSLASMLEKMLASSCENLVGNQKELLIQADSRLGILNRFTEFLNSQFDYLTGNVNEEKEQMLYFELLVLAQKKELEEMITVEGMVASARNLCGPNFIPFNARLDSLTENITLDDTNNPLDPSQITSAFEQAIQPLDFDPLNRLALFRDFNENLLKHMDEVLAGLNETMALKNILPELKAIYPKAVPSRVSGSQLHDPALFSTMQGLLHKNAQVSNDLTDDDETLQAMVPTGSGIMQPVQFSLGKNNTRKNIEILDPSQLMDILETIQKSLQSAKNKAGSKNNDELFDPYFVNEMLGNLLSRNQSDDTLLAVDRNSSDVINLVTMLFAAIWQDDGLPVAVRNLIGDTQLIVTKLALSDTRFFNNEHHSAREFINELANTAAEWADEADFNQLPIFQVMRELVSRITSGFKGETEIFESALKDLRRNLLKEEKSRLKELEEKIASVTDRQHCLDDINQLVSRRVNERIAGRKIHKFYQESIDNFFKKYLVLLVIKEGVNSINWKNAFQSLDVLLWTLEFNKEEEDADRVKTANSGIRNMLRKILKVSKIRDEDIDTLLDSLLKAQNETLTPEQNEELSTKEITDPDEDTKISKTVDVRESPSEDEPFLLQVDSFNVGTWVEISGLDKEPLRCKLAAKIKPLDKYIFVNREGAKVAETSRAGLASDLKNGKVQLVSDGMLFSRALESVIGNLQQSQDLQQGNTR